jgi:hypothetical protein
LFYFSAIASKELTILQLVEDLQPDLLHQQPTHRLKTVSTISAILEQLVPELKGLNEKEVELLTEFFCSKLKDHHSILPAALQGLHALVCKRIKCVIMQNYRTSYYVIEHSTQAFFWIGQTDISKHFSRCSLSVAIAT